MTIKVFGSHDENVLTQLENCIVEGSRGVLCADGHLGYSLPIGGAVAYENFISPSGVGYDIGCGNKAVRTHVHHRELDPVLPQIMDEIKKRIAFGVGRSAVSRIEGDEVLDQIKTADFAPQRQLYDLAASQLGTVGAGNHYVDLLVDGEGYVWVGVHFGSRGFGHKTASGFLALAQGLSFTDKAKEADMMAPPTLLDINTDLGQAYIEAMKLAGAYAYAGRNAVVDEVLDILDTRTASYEVHNHHNFAWQEEHFGKNYWVIRKGCTPAFPGQEGFVGGSMGDISVILVGRDTVENAEGLFSTVHGAGRAMSRMEAAGKHRKRVYCRSCGWTQGAGVQAPTDDRCPECLRYGNLNRKWVELKPGKIDWQSVQLDLRGRGIELRGGAADEAPGAYKRLPEVLEAHSDTIDILHTLTPIGVAMAGANEWDPYKD